MTELRSYQSDAIEAVRPAIGRKTADHTGKRFGMWEVKSFSNLGNKGNAYWRCICDCGQEKVVPAESLLRGKSKSCGCSTNKMRSDKCKKHGHTGVGGFSSRTYKSWHSMRQRCENSSHMSFHDYGGRGIRVCERWKIFANFLEDMGERPDGKTLDRKRVNDGYFPDNCKWSTKSEQMLNQRPKIKNKDVLGLIYAAQKLVCLPILATLPETLELKLALKEFEKAK